jgi:1-acyl-sn-glycerol-3-phosphate acyltransferase
VATSDIETARKPQSATYDHSRWEFRRRVLRFLLRYIGFNFLAKLDLVEGLENVPSSGPGILMINHIAFVDSIVVLHVVPRNIVPLAKIEVYDYPLVGIIPRLWNVIPVRRDEVDRRAVRMALEVLQAGEMILMAPEGTRGESLKEAKGGLAYIASRADVPVIPVAIENTIGFPTTPLSPRWRGPGACVRFGKPFRFKQTGKRPSREEMRVMTDEAMYIMAAMLPEHRRGAYAALSRRTTTTIEWL